MTSFEEAFKFLSSILSILHPLVFSILKVMQPSCALPTPFKVSPELYVLGYPKYDLTFFWKEICLCVKRLGVLL